MVFSILLLIIIMTLQILYLKGGNKLKSLVTVNGILLFVLVLVGFLYIELILVLPIVCIILLAKRYKFVSSNVLSFLMSLVLFFIVVYCQFFNGILSMNSSDFYKVYNKANYHHEFFPIKIKQSKNQFIIYSVELAIRWKEKPFQETVWLDGKELLYSHDKCGFGEMCAYEYKYGSNKPYNFP